MESKLVFLSCVETQCERLKQSQYIKSVEEDNNSNICNVLLSIFNLKKIINDQNLLMSVNITKLDNELQQNLCNVLYDNICVQNTKQKFLKFVTQFNISLSELQKQSLLIPFDVLINDLSKHTIEGTWQQSIASLATTEYILTILYEKLNKFVTSESHIKLNTDTTNCKELLSMLDSQQMSTKEIEFGITKTVESFESTFEVLCEIFFNK